MRGRSRAPRRHDVRRALTLSRAPRPCAAAKQLVQLRDGRKIIGIMRSFDQFANIVLENAVERMIVGTHYSDVPLGLYIVRGENVVLMGDIDEAIELKGLTWVENDEIRRMKDAEMEADKMHGLIARNLDMLLDD